MFTIKVEQDNLSALLGVTLQDSKQYSVKVVEFNGMKTTSGRVFRSKNMKNVYKFAESFVIDESTIGKYNIKPFEQPNKPKRRVMVLAKVHNMHLERRVSYRMNGENVSEWKRVASSYLVSNLKDLMHEHGTFRIVKGGVVERRIPEREYERAISRGLILADITKPEVMKGASGKSMKILKAGVKIKQLKPVRI